MIVKDFETQMARLIATYGGDRYPKERVQAIWRQVQRLHERVFAAAVERLIAEDTHAPMVPRILEMVRAVEAVADRRGAFKAGDAKFTCRQCGGSGWVLTTKRGPFPQPEVSFRCSCSAGAKIPAALSAEWGPQHEETYRPFWEAAAPGEAMPPGPVRMKRLDSGVAEPATPPPAVAAYIESETRPTVPGEPPPPDDDNAPW